MNAPTPTFVFEDVTRVTIVGLEGAMFERYDAYSNGVELHLQDDGRTLKIFPRREESE
jgi:hypothetical protein